MDTLAVGVSSALATLESVAARAGSTGSGSTSRASGTIGSDGAACNTKRGSCSVGEETSSTIFGAVSTSVSRRSLAVG